MAWNAFGRFGGNAIAVRGGEELRHDRRWFADEVAIDFPSVAPAIERMRSAFLADEHVEDADRGTRDLAARSARRRDRPARRARSGAPAASAADAAKHGRSPARGCAGSGVELMHHQVHITVPAGVEDGACFHFSVSARHDLSTRIELRVLVSPPAGG